MRNMVVLALVALMVLNGCQYFGSPSQDDLTGMIVLNDDDFVYIDDQSDNESMVLVDNDLEVDITDDAVAFTKRVVEGEMVSLDLKATDPDGDEIDYTFTEPLNAQGRWQTVIGDEGRYLITVTASDGRLSTSEDVLIIVDRANRAPNIECPDTVTVKEGQELFIDCSFFDEEGNNILTSYEGWVTSSRKMTTFDDAGTYTVLVRASDGKQESTKTVNVIVENVNRAPTLEPLADVTIMETQRVYVSPLATDPDGDSLIVSYSAPLNADGQWLTDDGDAGVYEVLVTVSDGLSSATEEFTLTVTQINTAPVLKFIPDLVVDEGDRILIPVNAYDPEGDDLVISYRGFMDEQSYQTSYDDQGEYEQSVTVSDGVLEVSQTFTITVNDKNRPPVFVFGDEQ